MIQDGRNSEGVASDEARATAASQSNHSVSSIAGIANALDICACGHERRAHPNDGPCSHGDYHKPLQCVQFRLSATSLQILEGMEEWARICEGEGK